MSPDEAYMGAARLIEDHPELADFVGVQPADRIAAAEAALGGKLPPSYRRFVEAFGAGGFGSVEIYGVFRDDFEDSGVPDAVWYTLSERRSGEFPSDLVVVHNPGFGPIDCVVLTGDQDAETPVVSVALGAEEAGRETLAASFGEFLLELIEAELADG